MKFLIPAIIGSIIGYFTNWIAIKMLFRPYEEKRIFGLKVPFTPGLIPKERHRVAKSVGDTVGNYLLTKEKFEEILKQDETKAKLTKFLIDKRNYYNGKEESLKNILTKYIEIDDEDIYKGIDTFYNKIIEELKSEENKLVIINILDEIYNEVLKLGENTISSNSNNIIESLVKNEKVYNNIYSYIRKLDDNRKIGEVIDDKYKNKIDFIIDDNKFKIVAFIRKYLNDDEIKEIIYKNTVNIINNNISPIITTFISKENISRKINTLIYDYIEKDEFSDLIIVGIDKLKKELYQLEINSIKKILLFNLDRNQVKILLNDIIDSLINLLKDSDTNNLIKEKLLTKVENFKASFIYNGYKFIIDKVESNQFKDKFSKLAKNKIDNILDNNINIYIKYITDDKIKKYVNKVFKYLDKTDYKLILNTLKVINIPKIVEDQINSFELDFAEELILEIAGKELKAITNLGALIGAVIGLLNPILQMI